MEDRTQMAKHNRRTWLRLVGLILGIVGAAAGFAAFFWWAVGAWQHAPSHPDEWLFMVLVLIRWGVVAAAWKWQLIGGGLLILDSSFVATFLSYAPLGLLLSVCLPLMVSGILFILSWEKGREGG